MVTETMMPVHGIELCVETFGESTDPAVLLIGDACRSMDWWDDEFCRRLAAGARHVIRYDHRDTGRSTSFPAGVPPYAEVDLAHDALGVLDALGLHRVHLVGFALGAALGMRIAVERPHRVLSLTLIGAGPDGGAAPHPTDLAPDWSDRRTAVARLAEQARALGGAFTAEPAPLRRLAERVADRTRDMTASQLNHRLVAPAPPLRHRLGSITAPTLVLRGTLDPVVSAAQARAVAAEIPGARVVELDGVGHEYPPPAIWSTVLSRILDQPARGHLPA